MFRMFQLACLDRLVPQRGHWRFGSQGADQSPAWTHGRMDAGKLRSVHCGWGRPGTAWDDRRCWAKDGVGQRRA